MRHLIPTRKTRESNVEPKLSALPTVKHLSLNKAAFNALGQPRAARIDYDKNRLVIVAAERGTEGAFSVYSGKAKATGSIPLAGAWTVLTEALSVSWLEDGQGSYQYPARLADHEGQDALVVPVTAVATRRRRIAGAAAAAE